MITPVDWATDRIGCRNLIQKYLAIPREVATHLVGQWPDGVVSELLAELESAETTEAAIAACERVRSRMIAERAKVENAQVKAAMSLAALDGIVHEGATEGLAEALENIMHDGGPDTLAVVLAEKGNRETIERIHNFAEAVHDATHNALALLDGTPEPAKTELATEVTEGTEPEGESPT